MESRGVREVGIAVAFLFTLAALYFLPVLAQGNSQVLSSVDNDIWGEFFYWRHFGFGSLAHGEIPLWNPYVFAGTPFVAGMQSAIFYPLNLLYLVFGTPFAINLSIALHCFLASLFTYLFARYIDISRAGSILSAITFAYGAPFFLHIYPGHLSVLSTASWLPLTFMGIEAFLRNKRMKYAVLSGLSLSMQVVAGHPQYLFYSVIAVSFYFFIRLLFEKKAGDALYFLGGFCLFLITGISLSAVQLAPTLELAGYSLRETLSYEWVSIFSFPPENFITLLLPDFFGDILTVPYWGKNNLWEMSSYLGVVPLVMAIAAILFDRSKSVLTFALMALASALLALGKYTPLLEFLHAYVPGFNLFRGLAKFVFVFSFACSLLAGHGLTRVAAWAEERNRKLQWLGYGLLAFFVLSSVVGISGLLYGQEPWQSLLRGYIKGEDHYSAISLTGAFLDASMRIVFRDLFKAALLVMLLGGMILVFIKLKGISVRALILSMLVLAVFDCWSFGSRYLVSFNPELLYLDKELKTFLKADRDLFRVATPFFPLHNNLHNSGMLEGIENVGGYDAIVLRNHNEFINFTQGLSIDEPSTLIGINRTSPLLNLLNVRYFIVAPNIELDLPNFELVFRNDHYHVYRDNGALPRSFIVHDVWVLRERETILRAMANPNFDPTAFAIVEEPVPGLPYNRALRSPVPKIVEHSPSKVLLQADLREPGFLVLADAFYPGWKVFVDGRESKIYRTNHTVRGVFLLGGRHRVEFRYDPLSFEMGVLISLTSLVLVVGFLIWCRFKA